MNNSLRLQAVDEQRGGKQIGTAARTEITVDKLPMDFTGRPLKGFVYVEPQGLESDGALESWIDRCLSFVLTLPPK